MVTSYYIMKMSARKEVEFADYYSNISKTLRSNGNKCRICLREGSVPIFGNGDSPDLPEALVAFADVVISEQDQYPQHLCKVCHKFLRGAILFRKTAQVTDQMLRKPVKLEAADISLNLEHEYDDTEDFSDKSSSKWEDVSKPSKKSKIKLVGRKEKLPPKVTCNVCKKVYDRKYYKLHLTMHDPNHEKKHICEICGKAFRLKSMYYGHRKFHESDFPFKCNQCPYRARQKHVLKLHTATHTGEFKYACTECPKRFHFISNMNIHILKKHREPEFKCSLCDKMFHRRIAMERHIEADHLCYRNHLCNICGKAFGYRGAMMKHQRGVHKREKLMSGMTPAYLRAQIDHQAESEAGL